MTDLVNFSSLVGEEDERQVYVSHKEDCVPEMAGSPAEVLLAFLTGEQVPRDFALGELRAVFEPLDDEQ